MKIGMKLIWVYVVLAMVGIAVLAVMSWMVRIFKRICHYGKEEVSSGCEEEKDRV